VNDLVITVTVTDPGATATDVILSFNGTLTLPTDAEYYNVKTTPTVTVTYVPVVDADDIDIDGTVSVEFDEYVDVENDEISVTILDDDADYVDGLTLTYDSD
jgi:hypothetical protein